MAVTAIDCHRRSVQRAEQRAARLEKERKNGAAIWRAGEREETGLDLKLTANYLINILTL